MIAFFLMLLLGSANLHVKAEEYPGRFYFNHLSNNDGLSSNKVNCIFEDSGGFIWFGTEDGLNLFDGMNIKVFRTIPGDSTSLHNNSIYAMAVDPETGNLWIGTRLGISYFDKSTYTFESMFLDSDFNDIADHIIFNLVFDKRNRLWISTSYGLFCYNSEDGDLKRYIHDSKDETSIVSNLVNHVYVDDDEHILVSTRGGLDLFNPDKETFTHLFQDIDLRNVMQVYSDSRKNYWICTDNMGLYNASFSPEPVIHPVLLDHPMMENSDRIHSVLEDEKNNLFFVARDKGIFYLDVETALVGFYEPDIFDTRSLNSKALISATKSSSGIIWFGTYNRGVNFIDFNRKPFDHYKMNYKESGLINNNVRAFFQDSDGNIWVGTKEGGGLSKFDPASGTFTNFSIDQDNSTSISSDYILAINELDADYLILGTLNKGIELFNKRKQEFSNILISTKPEDPSSNKIYSICKDIHGKVFVASLNKLYSFDRTQQSFTDIKGIRSVKCMVPDKNGGVWMGTKFDGLFWHSEDSTINYAVSEDAYSLSSNDITSVKIENDTILWIGTSAGLNRMNRKTGRFTSWNEVHGLASNRICAVEIDNSGHIWASTTNGLSRFDPLNEVFRNYYVSDGLQGNEFETYVSLKAASGELFFGGSNGFNMFNSDKITDKVSDPVLHFIDFKIANRSQAIGKEGSPLVRHIDRTEKLVLNHKQADFTFEFLALNYTSPEKNKYSYILENYDSEWSPESDNTVATYTNISPGDYVFKIKASTNDLLWSSESRDIYLTILPPPWKTTGAYLIYVLIIASLFAGLYFTIVRRIEQKNLLLLERSRREKQEQVNQMKLRFFTNISHEFRTPLTLISSPLSKLLEKPDMDDVQRTYLYQTMSRNVRRLLRLIRQLMDFRKLENNQISLKIREGNITAFVSGIIDVFRDYAASRNISIDYHSSISLDEKQWFDNTIIDGVIFNLLSNALKFSEPGSSIKVNVAQEERCLLVSVTDYGIGISESKIGKVFDRFYSDDHGSDQYAGSGIGLSFSKSLIELHKGTISVQSEPGVETVFSFQVPVHEEAYSEEELTERKAESYQGTFEYTEADLLEENSYFPEGIENKDLEKILFVEDNRELRKFLKIHFSNFTIYEAGEGMKALELARKKLPDLVVSDVMMPGMDGMTLCKELKSDYITSHIPVILLTAKTTVENKKEGFSLGADAYIEKPFDIGLLEIQVRSILQQRKNLRKRFSNQEVLTIPENELNLCDQKFFKKAEEIVLQNMETTSFSVDEFSDKLNMSRSQLFRKFKTLLGITPSDFIRSERLKKAKQLLDEGEYNINEISVMTGFSSPSHFISSFKKLTGKTPKEYLRS